MEHFQAILQVVGGMTLIGLCVTGAITLFALVTR